MNPVGSGPLRFGNFEVLSRPDGSPHLLGGGAFGKTYKARHLFLDQIVALKVINEQFLNDRSIKERFLREARVVHGLRHPHIAHVMDFGEVAGTLYYAMDFCEGGSLDDFIRRLGPQDAPTVQRFARQMTEALGCAHGRGFIHRDIKPANVMLAEAKGPPLLKLVDFGLVKNLQPTEGDGTASLTLDGQHFFTILFASPEQLMEEALDARSDLFSLGMTLWFLLKGSAPESGASATVVAKRLGAEPYRGQLPPSLPAGFRAILAKLLEKSPDDRYQSAAEVLAALDELERPAATVVPATVVPATVVPPTVVPERRSAPAPTPSEATDADADLTMTGEDLGAATMAGEDLASLTVAEAPPPPPPPPAAVPPAPSPTVSAAVAAAPPPPPPPTTSSRPPAPAPTPPAAVPPPPPPPPPPPVPSGPPAIEKEYLVLQSLGRGPLGPLYRVQRRADKQTLALTLLSDTFQEDTARLEDLRRDVNRLKGAPHEAVARVFGFQEFAEGTVLAQEWTAGGISLFAVLKARGSLAYADALRALRPAAEGADFLQALDVPGAALGAEEIFLLPEEGAAFAEPETLLKTPLRSWPPFRVRVRPVLAREDTGEDAGATMGEGVINANDRVEFAALLYQLVAGRRPSTASRMTRTAYTAVSGLGEESNRLLSACLCDESGFDGCVGVLNALSRSEGVNEAAGPRSLSGSGGHRGSLGFGGATAAPPVAATARATVPPPPAPASPPPAPPPTSRAGSGSGGFGAFAPPPPPPPAAAPPPVVPVPLTVPPVSIAPPPPPPPPTVRATTPPPPAPAPYRPAPSVPGRPPAGKKPGVPPLILFGVPMLLLGLAFVVAAVYFLTRPRPTPDPDSGPTPRPTVSTGEGNDNPPPVTPGPTSTAAREFTLLGGVRPVDAAFELNGRVITPTRGAGGSLVIPVSGGSNDTLKVSARGHEPRTLPVPAGGSLPGTLELARQTVRVSIVAERNRSDYATAVFTMLEALPGERTAVGVEPNPVSVELNALPAAADLPTGLYRVNLQGAGGRADATVQPFALLGGLAVRAGEAVSVALPPSFAGRYEQEFTTRLNATTTAAVTRVLVIEPGLGGGHVDDSYVITTDGNRGPTEQLRGVPVGGLRVDERGTLRGLIRFTQLAAEASSYDEQFEITYSPQTRRLTIQGGDWEVEPDDPAQAAALARKVKRAPHKSKPPPRPLVRRE